MKTYKITLIGTAISIALASQNSFAQDQNLLITNNTTINEDINIVLNEKQGNLIKNVLSAQNSGKDVTANLNGKNINVTVNDANTNVTNSNVFISALNASSFNNIKGSTVINAGSDNTSNININMDIRSADKNGNKNYAIGVWAYKNGVTNTNINPDGQKGGVINLKADNLNIDVKSDGGAYGLCVQNSTSLAGPEPNADNRSTINILAKNTHINVVSGLNNEGNGLVAMSQGRIFANSGNLFVKADNVILARGDAVIEINKNNNHTVQLDGDINFNYDKATSSTEVDSKVTVNLSGKDSYWNGNACTSYDKKPADPDLKVNSLNIAISDNAKWNVGVIEDDKFEHAQEIAVNNVTLNNGIINALENTNQMVRILNLEGKGGSINLKAEAQKDGSLTSSNVQIDNVANSNTYLNVGFDGITSDDVKNNQQVESLFENAIVSPDKIAQNSTIDEGNINGAISQHVDQNGNKSDVSQVVNTKLDSYKNMLTLASAQWRHETSSLGKRLGEIRTSPKSVGVWARAYGSEYELGHDEVTFTNNSVEVGFDTDLNNGFKVGAAVSYTDGDTTSYNGKAENDIYSLGLYGTYLADNGVYVDLTGKFSKISNDFTFKNFSGNYDNNAYSLSLESGWNLKLNDTLFIEPQAQFIYGKIVGDNFTASNGVNVNQDDTDAKLLRGGVRAGFNLPEEMGVIYAKASLVHDFDGQTDFTATKDGNISHMSSDLGGTWGEFGLGANINWSKNTYTYVEIEKTSGSDLEENYRWNIGIRHNF